MKKRLPNILTVSRLALVPVFLLMLIFHDITERWLFLFIFFYASVTDFLDGHLARVYNSTSLFGRVFDSLADKLLVLVVAIVIMLRDKEISLIILIPIIIILSRELLISGLRESLADKKITLLATTLAKYKTTLQLLALGFLIVGGQEQQFYIIVQYIGIVLLYLAMLLSLFTGLQYMKKANDHL